MARVLVPPPATKADEVVAEVGGMFYTQESPDRPPFVKAGDHFAKGQTLYIIEVMKMFNRVQAPSRAGSTRCWWRRGHHRPTRARASSR